VAVGFVGYIFSSHHMRLTIHLLDNGGRLGFLLYDYFMLRTAYFTHSYYDTPYLDHRNGIQLVIDRMLA
jgi:hypothetical protein